MMMEMRKLSCEGGGKGMLEKVVVFHCLCLH